VLLEFRNHKNWGLITPYGNPEGWIRFTDLSRLEMLISKKFEKLFETRKQK